MQIVIRPSDKPTKTSRLELMVRNVYTLDRPVQVILPYIKIPNESKDIYNDTEVWVRIGIIH